MTLLTLATVRADLWDWGSPVIPYASATTAQKAAFDAKINLVCERLLLEQKARYTMRRITLPIYADLITLPRYLLSCSGIKLVPNGTDQNWYSPLRIYGGFHEFHYGSIPAEACTGAIFPTNQMAQTFITPTGSFKLRCVATEAGGNISLIGGTDSSDAELFGTVALAITNGTTTTSQVYNTLPHIQKPATTNRVLLYSVDNTSGVATLIAVYAPGETVPAYTQYTVANPGDSPSCFALCKIAFVKAVADSDIVYPNLYTALRYGLSALARELSEQPEHGLTWWRLAQDALDKERQQYDGDHFSEVVVEPGVAFGDMPYTI